MSQSQPAIPASYGEREAVSLESLMDKASAPGWEFFAELLGAKNDKLGKPPADERSEDAARAAARMFKTPDGKILVEYLADMSVRRPVFTFGMPDAHLYGAMREGQNALFFTLLKLIAAGRGEAPPVREGA